MKVFIFIIICLFIYNIHCKQSTISADSINNAYQWMSSTNYKGEFTFPSHYVSKELSTDEKISNFLKWVDDNGAKRNFDIISFPDQGFGGIANKDLTPDDILSSIPYNIIIPLSDKKDFNGFNNWSGMLDSEPLILWLLKERLNPNSFWKPYFDILPESFESHILVWNNDEFKYAKNTTLRDAQLANLKIVVYSYEHLKNTLIKDYPESFPEHYFSLGNYIWCYLTIITRAWTLEDGNAKSLSLVPLADMLNHKSDCGFGIFSLDTKIFTLNSTTYYSKGEQVYDNYGPKSNFELLSTYGFVEDNNKHNAVIFDFTLYPDTNLVHRAATYYFKHEGKSQNKVTVSNNTIPHDLLRLFRMNTLSEDSLEYLETVMNYNAISIEGEDVAYNAIINSINRILETSFISEEEENNILLDPSISNNIKNTIKLRKSDRKMYYYIIDIIKQLWVQILLNGTLIGGKQY